PSTALLPAPRLIVLRPTSQSRLCRVITMERFTQLFGRLLVFVYHCFDRIVINGYLSGLSRPEQVVHFVREVLGIPVVRKEALTNARTITRTGWRLSPATIRSLLSGREKVFARKITCCPRCDGW